MDLTLAAVLETDATTVMVICDALERKGLLVRERDPRDRRANRLRLTDEGQRRLVEAYPAVERLYAFLPEVVGAEDLAAVLPVLERIAGRRKAQSEGRRS